MPIDPARGEELRRTANLNVQRAKHLLAKANEGGAEITYDRDGLCWLDQHLDQEAASGDQSRFNTAYWLGGAFFGECVLRSLGGYWAELDDTQQVEFDELNGGFPFNTVLKRLDGDEMSSTEGAFLAMSSDREPKMTDDDRRVATSRTWWGNAMAVDGEVFRNFHPATGDPAEVLAGAFAIVRNGDARAVAISLHRSQLEVADILAAYEASWAPLVAARDPRTRCRYTGDAAAQIDAVDPLVGPDTMTTLLHAPHATPSLMGRDLDRF